MVQVFPTIKRVTQLEKVVSGYLQTMFLFLFVNRNEPFINFYILFSFLKRGCSLNINEFYSFQKIEESAGKLCTLKPAELVCGIFHYCHGFKPPFQSKR